MFIVVQQQQQLAVPRPVQFELFSQSEILPAHLNNSDVFFLTLFFLFTHPNVENTKN